MSFYDWSTTASNNGAIDAAINWAEFQDPSTVNDSARAMMARVAEWRKDVAPTRSSTGSGNAYAVTSEAGGSTAYRDGEIVTFIADRANTSACTLNVNARGAKAFRPAIGVDFKAGEIQANQAIIAFYRSATEEFIGIGSGYHVSAMTTGLLSQSIAARLIKIGTPVLSLAPTAPAGYIRLTEATQTRNKSDWPELDTWLSSISYPWGSTSTTFNLPPAAGYVLRFAATSSTIDTAGARSAGSTQTDAVAAHTHTFSATTSTDGAHTHNTTIQPTGDTTAGGSGGTFALRGYNATAATSSSGSHSHTISGTTSSTGGTETRPRNVAMHVDIFASSQQSAGTLAMFGFPYAWDTGTTAADPGSARVRGNNATLASITALYINETDAWGVDIGAVLGAITNGSVIRLSKVGAQANTLVMTVSGSITDSGTYRAIPVTVAAVNGSFSSNDSLAFELAGGAGATGATGPTGSTGPTGATGAAGANGTDPGIRWLFDSSTTTNADPGSGDLRLNNATLASVTEIAISYSSGEAGNPSVENFIKAWDDSTTTSARGTLIIKKPSAPQNFAIYKIASAITDGTTYGRFTLSYLAGSGSFSNADTLAVQFFRTGDTASDSRNRIINGDFSVDQRNGGNETTISDNAYWADRWRYIGEASAACKARSTDAVTNGIIMHGYIKFTGTTDKGGCWQIIEGINCKDLRGKSVTVSAELAVSNTRLGNIKMGLVEWTSTENATTADPVSAWGNDGTTPTLAANYTFLNTPANLSVTTSMVQYSVTGTIGNSANNLAVMIWNDDKSYTANDTLYVGNVQLTSGTSQQPFIHIMEPLATFLCKRYYNKIGGQSSIERICSGFSTGTTNARFVLLFPEMRASPTVTPAAATNFEFEVSINAYAGSATNVYGTTKSSTTMDLTISGASEGLAGLLRAASTTNAVITLSAEI